MKKNPTSPKMETREKSSGCPINDNQQPKHTKKEINAPTVNMHSPSTSKQPSLPDQVDRTFSQAVITIQMNSPVLAKWEWQGPNPVLAPFKAEGSLENMWHFILAFRGGQFYCTLLVAHLVGDNPGMVHYYTALYWTKTWEEWQQNWFLLCDSVPTRMINTSWYAMKCPFMNNFWYRGTGSHHLVCQIPHE